MKWMRILFAIDFQDNVYYFYYIRPGHGEGEGYGEVEVEGSATEQLNSDGVAGKLWAFHNVNSRINTLFVSAK